MDNIHAANLPAFLDPLLDYLSRNLPSTLYDALVTILSNSIALVCAVYSLTTSLHSWKPWEWDAQTILPPLISILAAYYALLSLYRTTGWMVRMGVWAVKWGMIVSAIGAGLGWIMGQSDVGVVSAIRSMFEGQDGGGRDGRGRAGRSRSRTGRPRAWDSFEAHREWQYNEHEAQREREEGAQTDSQRVMQQIVAAAGRAFGGYNADLIGAARSVLDGLAQSATQGAGEEGAADTAAAPGQGRTRATRKQPKRKAKTAAERQTRSR